MVDAVSAAHHLPVRRHPSDIRVPEAHRLRGRRHHTPTLAAIVRPIQRPVVVVYVLIANRPARRRGSERDIRESDGRPVTTRLPVRSAVRRIQQIIDTTGMSPARDVRNRLERKAGLAVNEVQSGLAVNEVQ